jgi:CRP/FNR family transcriptional regulator, nitrogen oxide reductase regulator
MPTDHRAELEELLRARSSSKFLTGLSTPHLRQLAQFATLKLFGARTVVYRQGEPATMCLLVLEGLLKVYELSDVGHLTTITYIPAGEFCLGQALAGHQIAVFSVESVESARVLVWRSSELRGLVRGIPHLAWNVFEMTYERFQELAMRWRELVTDHVEQRIARALIRLAPRLGKDNGGEVIIPRRVLGQDLASYAGTTLFTVSRVLNRWERQGIIRYRRTFLALQDMDALSEIATTGFLEDRPPQAVSNS